MEASIIISFKANIGVGCTPPYLIPAHGLLDLSLPSISCLGSKFVGSAWITSNKLIAVASNQYHRTSGLPDALMESEMTANNGVGAPIIYAPLIQNNNYNWLSGVHIQNTSQINNTLFIDFWDRNDIPPVPCISISYPNIASHATVIESNPPGSACGSVISANLKGVSLPVAGTINQRKTGTLLWTDYQAVVFPGQLINLPNWYTTWYGWSSSANVYNFNGQSVEVTLTLYNSDGTRRYYQTRTIQPHDFDFFFGLPPAESMSGSATITSSLPVAVVANHLKNAGTGSGDGIMSHIGLNR